MSPVVKKKRKKITITSQQLLLVLTAVCAFLLIFTFNTNVFEGVLKQAAGYVVVPFQNGIATIGGYLSDRSDELAQLKDVLALNKDLQEQIDQLTQTQIHHNDDNRRQGAHRQRHAGILHHRREGGPHDFLELALGIPEKLGNLSRDDRVILRLALGTTDQI